MIHTGPAASADKREELKVILPPGIPADYLGFFESHDGAEICFDEVNWLEANFDCLRIDSVADMLDSKTRAALAEVFPDLFVIGSDGGGQVIAYDMTRQAPWPIVLHLPGSSEPGNAPILAASMTEFMQTFLQGGAPYS